MYNNSHKSAHFLLKICYFKLFSVNILKSKIKFYPTNFYHNFVDWCFYFSLVFFFQSGFYRMHFANSLKKSIRNKMYSMFFMHVPDHLTNDPKQSLKKCYLNSQNIKTIKKYSLLSRTRMTKTQANSSDNHHKSINNILITITRQITNEAFHTTIWATNMKFRPMRPRHSYSKTPITTIKHLHRYHLCRYITNDPMVCYNVFFF